MVIDTGFCPPSPMAWVFFWLTVSSKSSQAFEKRSMRHWRWASECAATAATSANRNSLKVISWILVLPSGMTRETASHPTWCACRCPQLNFQMRSSAAVTKMSNSVGTSKGFGNVAVVFYYTPHTSRQDLMTLQILDGQPISKRPFILTRSNAFVRSVKATWRVFFYSQHFSWCCQTENIMPMVEHFTLKPNWDSGFTLSASRWRRARTRRTKRLPTMFSNDIPL